MKNDVQYHGEAMMLLADFLHNVLFSRERWQSLNKTHDDSRCLDKRLKAVFKRLLKNVDFCAKKADKLLKCKITRIAMPNGNAIMSINMQPSHRNNLKKKNI